jgi:hypothetical protein
MESMAQFGGKLKLRFPIMPTSPFHTLATNYKSGTDLTAAPPGIPFTRKST